MYFIYIYNNKKIKYQKTCILSLSLIASYISFAFLTYFTFLKNKLTKITHIGLYFLTYICIIKIIYELLLQMAKIILFG
jgi:hypothetical protein